MPTYEYECVECGHRFEAFQAMSDDPLTECEHCMGPVKRLIFGGTGIIFKGSGFYVTDSSKAGKQSTTASGKNETEVSKTAGDNKEADSKDRSSKSEKSAADKKDSGTGSKTSSAKTSDSSSRQPVKT